MLVPPANFGIAEEGIYRCSKIETLNLSFLETLNLKTVVFVGGQQPSKFFQEFFERSCIQWYVVKTADVSSSLAPVNVSTSKPAVDEKLTPLGSSDNETQYKLSDNDDLMILKSYSLKRTFELLLNTINHNTILVDKTSIVVGVLRKMQKWNIASIINEYRLFSGKNCNYFAETLLEMISVQIIQEEGITGSKDNDQGLINNIDDFDEAHSCHEWEVIKESDLSLPPSIPAHLLQILQDVQEDSQETVGETAASTPLMRTQSDMGIFGNRYRLAFNKKERADYEFYKGAEQNVLTINIPKESQLPKWFIRQRDTWENDNAQEQHNFYRESIFV
ncbi:Oca4p [Lachancea thermotolerans CBS 6340]|uniref:KLTH0A07612p n=1 Tax=Lachancea thermotolerans (strain ATCC 56472 / CBS 6340 / NRRL Y-8284) TaxID=559295 RepID=C5DC41_LACTC|nr:KLTH0A07612p [Lachancea thermotolerans CBS 6340]CAR21348.1 KLTH0A07612p [Lachancea thermotolerans CBS 6340]